MSAAIESRHDAGGKGRFKLRPGTLGDALFVGERQEHRLWLSRDWRQPGDANRYSVVVGMNPSTARADEDDLTVRKDQIFSEQEGIFRMFKVNAGTYCSTDPKGLVSAGVNICHPENLQTIRYLAAGAALIIVATGDVPDILKPYAVAVFDQMQKDGRKMMCLGTTKSGWPKHSSRLAYSTPLEEFSYAFAK